MTPRNTPRQRRTNGNDEQRKKDTMTTPRYPFATPGFRGPRHHGFRGFDGVAIAGTNGDLVALDRLNGRDRFEAHFRGAGEEHARRIAQELCDTAPATGRPALDLDEAIATFTPTEEAHVAYTAGLSGGLAYQSDLLRAIVSLREQHHLSSSIIVGSAPTLASASDMTNAQCLAAADYLDDISGRLAQRAGIDPPWRVQDRQQVAAQSRADTPAHPSQQQAAAGRHSRRSDPPNGLKSRPGTAGGRHAAAHEPQHRAQGRR
ncbi:hypothetical protein [Amycolatopsis sp. WGS_07]|uniref:hypothetical protein n=1 Tax=Amycolatopsis sp. WGS_07 TaxID=3076764 RepID=UPI003872E7C2